MRFNQVVMRLNAMRTAHALASAERLDDLIPGMACDCLVHPPLRRTLGSRRDTFLNVWDFRFDEQSTKVDRASNADWPLKVKLSSNETSRSVYRRDGALGKYVAGKPLDDSKDTLGHGRTADPVGLPKSIITPSGAKIWTRYFHFPVETRN